MKKILNFIALLISTVTFLLFFVEYVYCKTLSAKEIIDSVANQLNGINTIEAEISQTILGASSSKTYEGNYIAAREGKFKVEYNYPYKQLVISDGDTLWWYIPDSRKVWYLEVNKNRKDVPQVCPANPSDFKFSNIDDFVFRLRKRRWFILGDKSYIIDLFPKSTSCPFSKVTLWIDSKNLFLQKYKIYDLNGKMILSEEHNRVTLLSNKFWLPQEIIMQTKIQGGIKKLITRYSNIKINVDIPENAFVFEVPRGIDKITLLPSEVNR